MSGQEALAVPKALLELNEGLKPVVFSDQDPLKLYPKEGLMNTCGLCSGRYWEWVISDPMWRAISADLWRSRLCWDCYSKEYRKMNGKSPSSSTFQDRRDVLINIWEQVCRYPSRMVRVRFDVEPHDRVGGETMWAKALSVRPDGLWEMEADNDGVYVEVLHGQRVLAAPTPYRCGITARPMFEAVGVVG